MRELEVTAVNPPYSYAPDQLPRDPEGVPLRGHRAPAVEARAGARRPPQGDAHPHHGRRGGEPVDLRQAGVPAGRGRGVPEEPRDHPLPPLHRAGRLLHSTGLRRLRAGRRADPRPPGRGHQLRRRRGPALHLPREVRERQDQRRSSPTRTSSTRSSSRLASAAARPSRSRTRSSTGPPRRVTGSRRRTRGRSRPAARASRSGGSRSGRSPRSTSS